MNEHGKYIKALEARVAEYAAEIEQLRSLLEVTNHSVALASATLDAQSAEIERLKAENEAVTAWGFKAYTELLNTKLMLDGASLRNIKTLLENAPAGVKGDECKK